MSAHHENTRRIAMKEFKTAWADRHPIRWPGDARKKPDADTRARFTIQLGETTNAAIGTKLKRTPLVFGCQLRIPANKGSKEAYLTADALTAALENKNFMSTDGKTTLKTRLVTLRSAGEQGGNQIFSVTITAVADTEDTTT